jgi:hypothetical protein
MDQVTSQGNVLTALGLVLVVLTVMANAYWDEMVRFANELRYANGLNDVELNKKNDLIEKAIKYKKRAKWLFKMVAALCCLTVSDSILVLIENGEHINLSIYILYVVLGLTCAAFFYFAVTNKFLVSPDPSE